MTNRFQELRDKEVIHVCEGTRLGYVNDLVIDICCGRVTALIVPGPCRFLGLFGREDDYVIPWLCMQAHRRRSDPGRRAACRVAHAAEEAAAVLSGEKSAENAGEIRKKALAFRAVFRYNVKALCENSDITNPHTGRWRLPVLRGAE